jgi:hypothetical protein
MEELDGPVRDGFMQFVVGRNETGSRRQRLLLHEHGRVVANSCKDVRFGIGFVYHVGFVEFGKVVFDNVIQHGRTQVAFQNRSVAFQKLQLIVHQAMDGR